MKPSKILPAIKQLIAIQRPAFLWGPPGIYKSDLVAQAANDLGSELRDVRLSLMDPVDLKGFPVPKDGLMSWLPPDFLPHEKPNAKKKSKGILFLDEMNTAPAQVQAAAYQLILNRRIGDYVLPEGWSILAAGNRTSDRSVVHAMPAALASRLVHIDCEVDAEDWIDWAIKHGISNATRGYIRWRPNNLCISKIEAGMRSIPTPRTWAMVDQIMTKAQGLDNETLQHLVAGTVGDGCAAEYMGFVREQANLPNIDSIELNPEKTPVPESPSTRYAVISMLEARVTASNIDRYMKYVARMNKEFEIVFVTAAGRRDDAIFTTKFFMDWSRENRSLLIA